jgi:hypothetical protein
MSEMIERVAKAIDSSLIGEVDFFSLDSVALRNAARAAIEAMLKPTEAMLKAGYNECPHQPIVPAWMAMIDAAMR